LITSAFCRPPISTPSRPEEKTPELQPQSPMTPLSKGNVRRCRLFNLTNSSTLQRVLYLFVPFAPCFLQVFPIPGFCNDTFPARFNLLSHIVLGLHEIGLHQAGDLVRGCLAFSAKPPVHVKALPISPPTILPGCQRTSRVPTSKSTPPRSMPTS